MKSTHSAFAIAITVVLCLASSSSAHLCTLLPTSQRGGVHDGDFTKLIPGDPTCAAPTAPCNGKPSEAPTFTMTAGKTYDFTIQQNLNHYVVGNPGFIDAAISYDSNPEANDDFYVFPTSQIDDYPAFTEWTQTNFTISVPLPEGNVSDHAVIRFRYVSNKPTEPEAFYSCVDVEIVGPSAANAVAPAPVSGDDAVSETAKDAVTDAGQKPMFVDVELMGVLAIDGESGSEIVVVNAKTGEMDTVWTLENYNFRSSFTKLDDFESRDYIADDLAAITRSGQYFLLHGYNVQSKDYDVLSYGFDPVTFDELGNVPRTFRLACDMPLMSLHFQRTTGVTTHLAGLGIQPIPNPDPNSGSTYQVVPLTIPIKDNDGDYPIAQVAGLPWNDTTHFVDFKDAQYDADTNKIYGLFWHEDSADTLPYTLVWWDLDEPSTEPQYWQPDGAPAISHFYVGSNSSEYELVGVSPGVADKDGYVKDPHWALYGFDLDARKIKELVNVDNDNLNVAPVSWAGGVGGHLADDESLYAMVGHLDAETATDSVIKRPKKMTAVVFKDNKAQTLAEMPYVHNLVQLTK
jgi:hypothetical protein